MDNPSTLLSLLQKYCVEIPRIQRDYVQGRKENEQAITVRKTLLTDIKNAIENKTKPLDLNFIYGKIYEKTDGNEHKKTIFLPVDGQQRLTTLFLIHLYAFAEDESKTILLHKFSYEARTTTRDFFQALVKQRKQVFSSTEQPSIFIKDAPWFTDSWKYDPSVNSALTMLDEIVDQNYSIIDLRHQLEETNSPPVFFHFVELADLGREDDLYIKINARGRSLTPFENLKSQLVNQCALVSSDLSQEIESALDIKWADYIWSLGKERYYDSYYLYFFQYVFSTYKLLKREVNQPLTSNWIYSFDYTKIKSPIFKAIRNTLNYISSFPLSEASLITIELLKSKGEYPYALM